MTVAKGANIPPERMLDAIEATAHASMRFEQWADIKAPELPTLQVDAMQVTLARWQNDRFGHVPTSDVHMALGVIEELGEAFDEDATAEDAIDALGDVMVYASQLCTANRLAVGPVIQLAEQYLRANHSRQQAITMAGMLAHVALKHAQNIRGLGPDEAYRPRLVDALAMMIAKALEDCVLGHELIVDATGVFITIGGEVTQRKQGDAMIPATMVKGADTVRVVTLESRDPEKALAQLHEAAAQLETPEAISEGNFTAPTFRRLTSNEQTDECPIWDHTRGLYVESDEQLAARIKQQHADLSA